MSATLTPFEGAVRDWAAARAAIEAIWANQNGSPPAYPYVLLNETSNQRLGAYDQVTRLVDMSRPEGQEVELRTTGVRQIQVSIQVFVANAGMVGTHSAQAILEDLRDSLQDDQILKTFRTAGLSPFTEAPLRTIPSLRKVGFEGRAQLDVSFYASVTNSRFVGFIQRIQGTVTADGQKPLPLDVTLP